MPQSSNEKRHIFWIEVVNLYLDGIFPYYKFFPYHLYFQVTFFPYYIYFQVPCKALIITAVLSIPALEINEAFISLDPLRILCYLILRKITLAVSICSWFFLNIVIKNIVIRTESALWKPTAYGNHPIHPIPSHPQIALKTTPHKLRCTKKYYDALRDRGISYELT